MALNFDEVRRVLEEAEKADNNKKEIRKAIQKAQSLVQGLEVALGDILNLLDADAPEPKERKERKPYTGLPRGRKKKVVEADGSGTLNLDNVPASDDLEVADITGGDVADADPADVITPPAATLTKKGSKAK